MGLGIAVFLLGGVIYVSSRLNIPIGRLPGDFRYSTENFTCVFPLASMLLISVFLTVLLNLVLRFFNR